MSHNNSLHHTPLLFTLLKMQTVLWGCYFSTLDKEDVGSCLLNASKAFDRMHYGAFFRLLSHRELPPIMVRLLINCYTKQSISVVCRAGM